MRLQNNEYPLLLQIKSSTNGPTNAPATTCQAYEIDSDAFRTIIDPLSAIDADTIGEDTEQNDQQRILVSHSILNRAILFTILYSVSSAIRYQHGHRWPRRERLQPATSRKNGVCQPVRLYAMLHQARAMQSNCLPVVLVVEIQFSRLKWKAKKNWTIVMQTWIHQPSLLLKYENDVKNWKWRHHNDTLAMTQYPPCKEKNKKEYIRMWDSISTTIVYCTVMTLGTTCLHCAASFSHHGKYLHRHDQWIFLVFKHVNKR